jgi:hypothetical protein
MSSNVFECSSNVQGWWIRFHANGFNAKRQEGVLDSDN